jgi:hypothetical protein
MYHATTDNNTMIQKYTASLPYMLEGQKDIKNKEEDKNKPNSCSKLQLCL